MNLRRFSTEAVIQQVTEQLAFLKCWFLQNHGDSCNDYGSYNVRYCPVSLAFYRSTEPSVDSSDRFAIDGNWSFSRWAENTERESGPYFEPVAFLMTDVYELSPLLNETLFSILPPWSFLKLLANLLDNCCP